MEAGVFWSILNRTIFWELTRVFLMSLVGLTGMLLLAGVISEASKEGLGPAQIAAIVPLIIPSTLPYTIPATTLFGSCVIYGRLAADNEILAIKAAGVNVMRVIAPGLFLGLVMSGCTFALYYALIPSTHHLMRTLFLADVESLLYTMLERDGSFKHPKLDYEIHVQRVQGRKLIQAQFMHRAPKGPGYDAIARAQDAELLFDLSKKMIHVRMHNCWILSEKGNQTYVQNKVWDVDLPQDLVDKHKGRPSDMTWGEMLDRKAEVRQQIEQQQAELATQLARLSNSHPPDGLQVHVENLHNQVRHKQQEIRDLDLELHKRPALAAGCLCFVLVGCPVGIWFSRSDYLSAFVTCFLPIVLLYYPLMLCGLNLSRTGKVPLLAGLWAANALVGLIAIDLYRRLLKN
jgi:lipopolysaccharide export system permease protein